MVFYLFFSDKFFICLFYLNNNIDNKNKSSCYLLSFYILLSVVVYILYDFILIFIIDLEMSYELCEDFKVLSILFKDIWFIYCEVMNRIGLVS